MPKVTSSVFVIHKYSQQNQIEDSFLCDLESFLKIAFYAPRKTLFKNLSQVFDKKLLEEVFENENIKSNARAHEVKTKSFHHILQFLKKRNDNGKQTLTRTTKQRPS